jgi:hypothetical protein
LSKEKQTERTFKRGLAHFQMLFLRRILREKLNENGGVVHHSWNGFAHNRRIDKIELINVPQMRLRRS